MAVEQSTVHACDACGHRAPGHHKDMTRPATLEGLLPGSGQGIMGTVEVATEDGLSMVTMPWYAHRPACIRRAIQRVRDGLRPPEPGGEGDDTANSLSGGAAEADE